MGNEFEFMKKLNDFVSGFNEGQTATIKDIADRFKEVLVKCPCCEHTIKFKVKV